MAEMGDVVDWFLDRHKEVDGSIIPRE
jgi:hypothetical protein